MIGSSSSRYLEKMLAESSAKGSLLAECAGNRRRLSGAAVIGYVGG
jgi:hypothetical protein